MKDLADIVNLRGVKFRNIVQSLRLLSMSDAESISIEDLTFELRLDVGRHLVGN
jgi:hypothetical protein